MATTQLKPRTDWRTARLAAQRPPDRVFAAYHAAGHLIAARVIGQASAGAGSRGRANNHAPETPSAPGRRRTTALLEQWLDFTASGHAAEREMARRLGLRWRGLVSNAGHDLEHCYRLIREETGEEHGEWILLHWTRAVTRATRILTANWGEVVRFAELNGRQLSEPACQYLTDENGGAPGGICSRYPLTPLPRTSRRSSGRRAP